MHRPVYLVVLIGILLSCGDGNAPTVPEVAGSYEATHFRIIEDGQTTDLLEEGASLSLTLAEDGSVSGRLFIPGGGENGSDLDASMEGVWLLSGDQVTFDQVADTFMNDMTFAVEDNRLSGERDFDDVSVSLVLER